MAINARYVDLIRIELKEIFNQYDIEMTGRKADDGYESISLIVKRIDEYQLKRLAELVKQIPNSFYIIPLPVKPLEEPQAGIRVGFF